MSKKTCYSMGLSILFMRFNHSFHFRLILNLDPLPTNFEEDTVEIFGIQWVTETALVNSSRVLFHLFRYVFLKIFPWSRDAVVHFCKLHCCVVSNTDINKSTSRVVLVVHLSILLITKLTVMFYGVMVLMNCFLVKLFFSRIFI